MFDERHFTHTRQVAAVAAVAFAVDYVAVRSFLLGAPLWMSLGGHFGLVAGLILWFRYSPGLLSDMRLPLLLVGGTAAIGPVGPAGTLVTVVLTRWYMRSATPFEEWYQALFPDTSQETGDEFVKRITGSGEDDPSSLAPFSEVLAFGSFQQKQALIALLNKSFRPAFGPFLKRALTDSNNAIRVQAATAMNRIERNLHARTVELDRKVSENPNDSASLRALAQHLDGYVYARILDGRREEQVRERALDAYRRCIALEPHDSESQIAAGRLLLRAARYSEAAVSLEKAIKTGTPTSQAGLWYMESLYNLGRFAELRAYARLVENRTSVADNSSPAALEALQMWAEDRMEVTDVGVIP